MQINPRIAAELEKNNGVITTADIIKLGFSKQLLSQYVKYGKLERIRQGMYILPDADHDDMFTLMLRSDNIIFSHNSALFLNSLSDRTPFIHTITIPNNTSLPSSLREECTCFYIKPELHQLGLITQKTVFGNTVRCYNAKRTICDLLRSRKKCDDETVVAAIKNYAAYKNKDLNLLSQYSMVFKVNDELKRYMEVLL